MLEVGLLHAGEALGRQVRALERERRAVGRSHALDLGDRGAGRDLERARQERPGWDEPAASARASPGVIPRARMSSLNELNSAGLSHARLRDEAAAAVQPVDHPRCHQALDLGAHGHPRQAVVLGQHALGRERRARPALGGQRLEDLAERLPLRPGGAGSRAGRRSRRQPARHRCLLSQAAAKRRVSASASVIAVPTHHRQRAGFESGADIVGRRVAALGEHRAVEPGRQRRAPAPRPGRPAPGRRRCSPHSVVATAAAPASRAATPASTSPRRRGAAPRRAPGEVTHAHAAGPRSQRRVHRHHVRARGGHGASVFELRRDVDLAARHRRLSSPITGNSQPPSSRRRCPRPRPGSRRRRRPRRRGPAHQVGGVGQRAPGRRLAGHHEAAAHRLQRPAHRAVQRIPGSGSSSRSRARQQRRPGQPVAGGWRHLGARAPRSTARA